ncbi:MAG: hypothetical protein M3Y89_18700, partial [Actinomycetota bacterium]|nr:hypothetical protein [Actinomycetota bacterium]
GAYNVGSGHPHSVGDMATAICAAASSPTTTPRLVPQVTGRWRVGDVRHIVASTEKAALGLGFRAQIGFDEGMNELAGPEPDLR